MIRLENPKYYYLAIEAGLLVAFTTLYNIATTFVRIERIEVSVFGNQTDYAMYTLFTLLAFIVFMIMPFVGGFWFKGWYQEWKNNRYVNGLD